MVNGPGSYSFFIPSLFGIVFYISPTDSGVLSLFSMEGVFCSWKSTDWFRKITKF
ncbi:hypothetical protein CLV95_105187 [Leptospira borgpetersenii serovar Javanica]|uniref:Uncharacterized protein n=1 Tax=Leptospira borgpetersenii serovar Ballum TaxID=280505 RepID=A0A0S2IW24_LEPBO|nr:hypothetical protein LBBP_03310 [Leptospira borgpetersenii serovar Ballum]ANH01817.1 Uncharacterized protein LB4E_2595 [Leptospira borgpetersenii str. 4E]PTM49043.1 hypothetical protein CLV95_105187 [Leptospira borgpetersenii serovar Javanica]